MSKDKENSEESVDLKVDSSVNDKKKKNTNLHAAKKVKNDEFYTQLKDVEAEIEYYKEHFKNKKVFCNCDDPEWSNFYKFFALKFKDLELKKLTTTHFVKDGASYKLEIELDANGKEITTKTDLKENGDFRSDEAIEILKDSDIVCTNPPFSLFRDYIAQLMEYEKKFLVIGSMNAITYKEIFKLIQSNELWVGVTHPKEFKQPDGSIKAFGNICYFTNLVHKKRKEKISFVKNYIGHESEYPKYDNHDSIEVSKVSNIPVDYHGTMGVPITFLDKYNPEQFQIIKFRKGNDEKDLAINGKCPYFRIIVKKKSES